VDSMNAAGRVVGALAIASVLAWSVAACSTGEEPEGEAGAEQQACAPDDEACKAKNPAATTTGATTTPIPTDGQKNGVETDVDCGGAGDAPRCEDGKACTAGGDCTSQVCKDGKCEAARGDDKVKNGDETDVDCGGANAETARCAAGKACKAHGDCESDACGYSGKCALAPSCAGHFGGDTCGAGEVGQAGAKHESCCTTAPISSAPKAARLDKYVVTAGRMRQFIERHKGNLRAFGQTLKDNPNWKPEWNAMLPTSVSEANYLLGPTGHGVARRGCDLGAARGRTYWMSDAENKSLGEPGVHPFSKDILDQKALNCVEFFMLQAMCIWDGGRLAKHEELTTAWRGGENRAYPWGNTFNADNVVHKYSYSFPEEYDKGNFVFVAPPGRRPAGNGKFGHSDLAGNLIEMTSTFSGAGIVWAGNGSWEGHAIQKDNAPIVASAVITRAYWATGGRCAYPGQ
jgi:hypothetical protein